ncbi:hypothetical protein C8R46DRAFT_1080003 [Mycena filopes]|nr:hypothetical protein C8R46DRAFT_1080003 [Mycena filopes]
MFAKFAAPFVAVALATSVMSSPIAYKNALAPRSQSFNNWGGISSLSNFDNFYGSDDFAHHNMNQVELVCHTEQITIIQQRLAVETQTIVFQQYYASLGGFSHDLTRNSGSSHHAGYDNNIVSHYGDFYNSDGSLSNYDFGFSGHDIGSNYYVPSSNWNQDSSPNSVGSAYQVSQAASYY